MKASCRMSIQERNCYCNKTGSWCKNMLQCRKCRRWFHDDCVQCLETPMLFGDRFFVFVCALCNSGSEYLARVELKWADIAHLLLYNMTLIYNKKYFDLDALMPYARENWPKLFLFGKISTFKETVWREYILSALCHNKKKFKNGNEVKKSRNLWGLRIILPPVGPHVVPTPRQLDNSVTTWEFKVSGRKQKIICLNRKYSKRVREMKDSLPKGKENTGLQNETAKSSVCQNGNKRAATHKRLKRTKVLLKDDEPVLNNVLDALIPIPPHFNRSYNPFKDLNPTPFKDLKSMTFRHLKTTPLKDFKSSPRSVLQPVLKRRLTTTKCKSIPEASAKSPEQSNKRQLRSPECVIIDEHMPTDVKKSYASNSFRHITNTSTHHSMRIKAPSGMSTDFKTNLSSHLQLSEKDSFTVIGRRVTTCGEVQYLIQWDR